MATSQPIGTPADPQPSPRPARTHCPFGQTLFGWTVTGLGRRVALSGRPIQYWKVVCHECGEVREFQPTKLRRGKAAQCNHIPSRTALELAEPDYLAIDQFPGYRVGRDGTVWTSMQRTGYGTWQPSENWRPKATSVQCGYLTVSMYQNGRGRVNLVHRLVLEAFVGPCPNGMQGCHFPDPDRTNNSIANLRWDTPIQNAVDRELLGRTARGETNGEAKLTELQVLAIRRRLREGETQKSLAVEHGVHKSTISLIYTRKKWTHI